MKDILVWIGNNKWCIPTAYLLIVSLVAIIITVYDKRAATKHPEHRTREATLFAFSALGGSVAMLITMLFVRHKTRHKRFMIGIPLIIVAQVAAVIILVCFGIISY